MSFRCFVSYSVHIFFLHPSSLLSASAHSHTSLCAPIHAYCHRPKHYWVDLAAFCSSLGVAMWRDPCNARRIGWVLPYGAVLGRPTLLQTPIVGRPTVLLRSLQEQSPAARPEVHPSLALLEENTSLVCQFQLVAADRRRLHVPRSDWSVCSPSTSRGPPLCGNWLSRRPTKAKKAAVGMMNKDQGALLRPTSPP